MTCNALNHFFTFMTHETQMKTDFSYTRTGKKHWSNYLKTTNRS